MFRLPNWDAKRDLAANKALLIYLPLMPQSSDDEYIKELNI